MQSITFSELKTFQNKENFIFFFSIPDLCGQCKIQEKEFEKYNIPNLIKVIGTITDEEGMMTLGIGALPCTMIFNKDNTIKTKMFGILYDKQMKELLKNV